MKKSELQQIIKEEISKVLNEEEGNFTLKFIKDFETPPPQDGDKPEPIGMQILRQVLEIVKSKENKEISINDLFQEDDFKDVTVMKPTILNWINQLIKKGYLAKA